MVYPSVARHYPNIQIESNKFLLCSAVRTVYSIDQYGRIKMNLLNSLIWPLRIWQLLALVPFGVTKKHLLPTKNTTPYCYAIISLCVHIILLVLIEIFSSTYIDWSSNDMGRFDSLVAITLVHISSCAILGETILKLNKQMNFLKLIIRIDFVLQLQLGIRCDYKKYKFQNNFITFTWIFSVLLCIIGVSITTHLFDNSNDERFWAYYIGPLFIYSLNYHRIVLYVIEIRRRYQLLNRFIERLCALQQTGIADQNSLQTFKNVSPVESLTVQFISESQLKYVRHTYQMLYEASEMINDLFLWSLPLCIGIDFHRLLVNVFYIFAVWLLQSYWLLLIVAIAWGCLNIAHLIVLSHACHTTSREVDGLRPV